MDMSCHEAKKTCDPDNPFIYSSQDILSIRDD